MIYNFLGLRFLQLTIYNLRTVYNLRFMISSIFVMNRVGHSTRSPNHKSEFINHKSFHFGTSTLSIKRCVTFTGE